MSRRVLIVDDEPNIRRMMRLTLESDGYEVEDAEDGLQALQLFGDGSAFDAVLLDQRMPNLDGIETLRRIKSRAPDARVIMITAFGSIELAVDAMKVGATDFLRKPLTPENLRAALNAALSRGSETSAPPPSRPAMSELPPIEVWTVNGFFIRNRTQAGAIPFEEHRFEVRHSTRGPQGEVIVTVNPTEVSRVQKESGRELRANGAFWHQRAERALANYLFRESSLPPGNRLVVDRVPDEILTLARGWAKD